MTEAISKSYTNHEIIDKELIYLTHTTVNGGIVDFK